MGQSRPCSRVPGRARPLNAVSLDVAIPTEARAEAEQALSEFCASLSSEPGADRLRYTYRFETNAAVLFVERPGFVNSEEWVSTPLARFRYSEARDEWSLYWFATERKWQRVSSAKATKDIRILLQALITDPSGVFWS